MKKITSFSAVIMIVIFTFTQFTGKAQSGFLEVGGGLSADQSGWLTTNPLGSIRASVGVADDIVAPFLEFGGGGRFAYNTTIKTMDLKRDSSVRRSTNAPYMQLGFSLCIPPGETDNLNHFRGQIFSIGGGMGFPDINYMPTGIMKVSLQGNYTGNGDKKLRLGCFTRVSFNFLFTPTPSYASAFEIGLRLEMYKVFSPD